MILLKVAQYYLNVRESRKSGKKETSFPMLL
jgi:hypothetical protein